jgi:hypothetical protein
MAEERIVWDDVDPRTRRVLRALDTIDLTMLDTDCRALRAEGLGHLIPLKVYAAVARALAEADESA